MVPNFRWSFSNSPLYHGKLLLQNNEALSISPTGITLSYAKCITKSTTNAVNHPVQNFSTMRVSLYHSFLRTCKHSRANYSSSSQHPKAKPQKHQEPPKQQPSWIQPIAPLSTRDNASWFTDAVDGWVTIELMLLVTGVVVAGITFVTSSTQDCIIDTIVKTREKQAEQSADKQSADN